MWSLVIAVNTDANILDDVDPTTEHPQITDYTHPIDPWGSATLGVDNGKVCFWGATDLADANSSAREYCGRVYGYTGPTLIAAQAGVFLPGGADKSAGLDARRRPTCACPRPSLVQLAHNPNTNLTVQPHTLQCTISTLEHALRLAHIASQIATTPASRHSTATWLASCTHILYACCATQFRRCRYFTHDAEATLLALEKPGPRCTRIHVPCCSSRELVGRIEYVST